MTATIIIVSILLILLFLLRSCITAYVRVQGGEYELKVKYLFFTIYPLKEKKKVKTKKIRKTKENEKKSLYVSEIKSEDLEKSEKASEEDKKILEMSDEELFNPDNKKDNNSDKSEKKGSVENLIEQIAKYKLIFDNSKTGISKIFKNIRFDDIVIDFVIADEDPAKAAIKYGAVSAATYNLISLVRCYFNISVKTVDINVPFNAKESRYDADFKVRLTLSVFLSSIVVVLWNIFKNRNEIFKDEIEEKKANKTNKSSNINNENEIKV